MQRCSHTVRTAQVCEDSAGAPGSNYELCSHTCGCGAIRDVTVGGHGELTPTRTVTVTPRRQSLPQTPARLAAPAPADATSLPALFGLLSVLGAPLRWRRW